MIKDRGSRLPAPVDRERAREHALLALRRDWAAGMQKDEAWRGGELDPDPIVLHDLNGWPLFHEFLLRRGERVVGSVKTAASQVLGAPVLTVEEGPLGWDPDRAFHEAMERARRLVPDAEIVGRELICYSFPKIGVRLDLADREGGEDRRRSLIFDAADFSLVRRFGADELEGQAAYSFYQEVALPRAERNLRRFEAEDRELEEVRRRDGDLLTAALAEVDLARVRRALAPELRFEFLPLYSSRVLKYGPRCNPHDCFMLYAQQTNVYCAVATGQMILDFYRWPYTQDEIAAAMGTGPGGTGNAGQEAGYESLTRKCMEATYDTSAQWAEAKAEIDANRPVKSGVPNHARACAGWKRQNFSLTGTEPKRWLRIYDPWPWNEDLCQGGKVVWEEWDSIEHTNFIYVRHRSSACS
ncbi:MAG TPA: C39 family peptidase [Thermoanaerobaculia bacterium]|nr:C39 family peptidase [Thermoanaerobaculia bacterium]